MTHSQHFVIALHYDGPAPETFDAEGIADEIYHSYEDADSINHLKCVVAHEETQGRPGYDDLEDLRAEYTPPTLPQLVGADLAIVSVVTEVLDYALGKRPIGELHEAIRRAQKLAVPVTPETLGHKPQTIRNNQTGATQ